MSKLFISILLLINVQMVIAQTGRIKGTVTDAKTHEALIGTTVVIKGTTQGSTTDFDGNYLITNLQPGIHNLVVSFISYDTQEFEVEVKANSEVVLNVALSPATLEIGSVNVVAKANRESENMLLLEQKKSVMSTQAIGAQEISRKGASDAEAAVTKITGISKQEGVKNVFVRGLGDRFNATTLNGFPIPSDDPEYKNISLDFFDSDIIKAIDVAKVFNGEKSGDVAGAEININSKELVGTSELSFKAQASANTETVNRNFLIPDGVSNLGFAKNTASPTTQDVYAFKNSLDPSKQDFQLGKSFTFSGGKSYKLGSQHNPFSFYVIGSYSNDFNFTEGATRQTTTNGTIFRDFNTKKYEMKASHLAMANVDYSFKSYKLSYNFLAIHTLTDVLRDDYGMDGEWFQSASEYGYKGLVRRQQINDNTLLVNQFLLNKEISKRLSADAGVAYNYNNGKEPDRRVNYFTYAGNDMLEPLRGAGRQHRYYGDLTENDINPLAKVIYKLTPDNKNISSIEVGYRGRFIRDDYKANSWDNTRTQATLPRLNLYNINLDSIFNQKEFELGHFQNKEYNVSSYFVDKRINSVYTQLTYQINPSFILDAGLKADDVYFSVNYNVNDGAKKGLNDFSKFYILPNFNLKYNLNDKNIMRLSASRTYTLPQSKEISPLLYEGPQWSSQGNPNLIPSTNNNLDLKWEYYLTPGELISVTVFGKIIQDPISRVEIKSANGFLSYANIANQAKIGGVEVEMRKNIFSIDTKSKLSTGLNFSYLSTGVDVYQNENSTLQFTNKKTKLEGAAPIIANADLSYQFQNDGLEFTASMVANYVSNRIYSIGVNGFKDIEENAFTTLDFVSSVKLKQHWAIKLKAQNLLNPEYKLTRQPSTVGAEPVVLRSYKKGLTFDLGLSYEF